MRFLLIIFTITLIGCGSTPYRDDYAKHVNLIAGNHIDKANFKFSFAKNTNVDLRGLYLQNNTADASPMMYQGGAGLIGLLVQIGTHSSLVESERNEKLTKEQEQANKKILPLISMSKEISLIDLIGDYSFQLVSQENADPDTINIKPIFFSNSGMTKLSLKSIVWLPLQEKSNSRKQKLKYKNLIQVYSPKLTDSQSQKLIEGDSEYLSEVLSSLLKTALYITRNELTGQYYKIKNPSHTFVIEDDSSIKVIRGTVVEEKCEYQIIQDVHSWLIAYPKPEATSSTDYDFTTECYSTF
ncbi:hypothetical protein C9I89_02210 [Photobacterium lipolyticum]|uniref:Uncharacterized protein n=2 Tax=Photobacterium lipolyticum TaxID=266810 RepID=A0A2T3N5D7_9GAMM|nr:hypothetical protein C9I89_02210 [Photobacterium lipolyticum]